ncbi:MAG: hypothetical protein JXC32_11225 [Anaerolineae bacterium]|nr:hypothetical protein [Anaerolineae bacterium]
MTDFDAEMAYLVDLARAVVEASRVQPGASVGGYGPNVTGETLIRPGGRDCYPAFWVRDFAMSLEADLFTPEEVVHALRLTASRQAAADWQTRSGSRVPRGAIADHITFGGLPIYFPGTLDDYEGQGMPFGRLPSLDDHYYFVEMAWYAVTRWGRDDLLAEVVDGMPLIERLHRAFGVPKVREATGMVWCEEDDRGVSFGFTDTVVHTGDLLFCSLLRHRAAGQMAALGVRVGDSGKARHYREIAAQISAHLTSVFGAESGLLRASTGKSAQPDVWGSAFAVYVGALPAGATAQVSRALCDALAAGTIAWQGQIRHVPTNADFSDRTMWESVIGDRPMNRYQNGAYWDTPVGWVCYAVAQHDQAAARQLALDYVADLQRDDFRKGPAHGAPWECAHPAGDHRQNPVYMASVTCPLGAFRRLGWVT